MLKNKTCFCRIRVDNDKRTNLALIKSVDESDHSCRAPIQISLPLERRPLLVGGKEVPMPHLRFIFVLLSRCYEIPSAFIYPDAIRFISSSKGIVPIRPLSKYGWRRSAQIRSITSDAGNA